MNTKVIIIRGGSYRKWMPVKCINNELRYVFKSDNWEIKIGKRV
jgi:hypothetical protein